MKDVMIDFETFGNGQNACVVQVGACYFDRNTGEIGEKFKMNVNAEDATKNGAQIDAPTVYWWLQQSTEAVRSILTGESSPEREVFEKFNDFLKKADAIWSHATFDYVILMNVLRRLGIKPKFSYRSARDIRTLVDLADVNTKAPRPESAGVAHDGLDDAIYQVSYCVTAMNKLRGKV